MGNCAAEENPTFRVLNNKNNQLKFNSINQNDYPSLNISNDIKPDAYINPISMSGGVYKISRKKKQSNKKLNKFNYFNNIFPIKDNNTNNSTTSKSKFTESSYISFSQNKSVNNNLSENFQRVNTFESEKSGDLSDININKNNDSYKLNKNYQEKKKLIRRKIHSSDKALEIMAEETLNKMNKKNLNVNNPNYLDKSHVNNNNLSIVHNINFK